MATYPNTEAASDVWSLRDVYKAEAGDEWPSLLPPLASNTWRLNSSLSPISVIVLNNVTYTGANVTQARLETLFESSNWQSDSEISRNDYYLNFGATSGDVITIQYNAPGTTSVGIRYQRYSSVDPSFTISGDITGSGTGTSATQLLTLNAPAFGEFTITTNNDSSGLIIQGIDFNGTSPGDLSYA